MRFRLASAEDYPAGLKLPWHLPLDSWPDERCTDVERGLHRNPVRFVTHEGTLYAIKELLEHVAEREYALLRSLEELNLPVVQPVGLVTDRPRPQGGEPHGLLVTRFLHHSMPFRHVISRGVSASQAYQLLDALADLLVNLHLAGFFWGDCSLSNALFRLDAGRYSAYLVDAETGEMHASLSNGQRSHDLAIAEENVAGEFMDLKAGFGLPEGLDPIELGADLVSRYGALWAELTREEVFAAQEQYRVDSRIKRVNDLGFDVEELDIETIEGGHKIRLRVQVVEPGHHRRRLEALTGLDVQENQARRLLNDLDHFRAWQGGLGHRVIPEQEAAKRWLEEVYRPTLESIPPEQAAKLDVAEIFHQLLEHRWYMSERLGRDLPLAEVVPSYVHEVLEQLPASSNVGVRADEAS
jgi:Domain of unknown function (DUF4032)/Lipopolysaccharide kinase (Kdo/WaaP) family